MLFLIFCELYCGDFWNLWKYRKYKTSCRRTTDSAKSALSPESGGWDISWWGTANTVNTTES